MNVLSLTSFYAGGKQNDDPIRQYFTLIVSMHLYIVIFVSLHFSCIPISKDEYSFIIIIIILSLMCNMSLSKVIFWVKIYIYIYVYKCMYVFISILYNNVLPSFFFLRLCINIREISVNLQVQFMYNMYMDMLYLYWRTRHISKWRWALGSVRIENEESHTQAKRKRKSDLTWNWHSPFKVQFSLSSIWMYACAYVDQTNQRRKNRVSVYNNMFLRWYVKWYI
jgi:hypothetical protein